MVYKIFTANTKTEKILQGYLSSRRDMRDKIDKLKLDPRGSNGAHPLHGRLRGKWGAWLGQNIRMIYTINDFEKIIIIEAVGSHKIY